MDNQANGLGQYYRYEMPVEYKIDVLDCFITSIFLGIIGGILTIPFSSFIISWESGIPFFFTFFKFATWKQSFFIGCIASLIITFIGFWVEFLNDKQRYDNYKNDLAVYEQNVYYDKIRVEKELRQKKCLKSQCDILAQMWRTSKDNLEKIYAYNILEEKYRNLVAVSSIYEYLKYERTRSLQRVGSDEGAYNMFETEMRLNRIITNTEIIIKNLDKIAKNQRELANIMYNAQSSINNLVESTNTMSANINNLNTSVKLSNYQQKQT